MLVIDDLHELDSAEALEWLEVFLTSLRWGLRVVLATREDPRLGLHRLRLSGQLTELRAPDLRFSMEETVELLRAEGITLSDGATALLYERTEGWAAGLRLAVISLAHHPDPERFVTEFSGSERNVAAYLLAEVLERQTPEVREMLLLSAGLELSEKAVRIADDHGWSEDPIVVSGLATGAMALLWLGRLDESESWLDRAERTLQPDGEPGTELIVHQARGLLRLSQGRLEEALAALRAAERMQAMLSGKHAFSAAVQARLLQTQVYMGRVAAARAALAEISEEERDSGDMRLATAVLHLAEGEADQATDVLAPVIDGSAPVIHRPSATTEAQLLDALAREQLGDRRAAEASLDRALDAAEPEGIVLPFVLVPVRDLLERLPRHRTAHPTLRRTILDVLDGAAPRQAGTPAGPPG